MKRIEDADLITAINVGDIITIEGDPLRSKWRVDSVSEKEASVTDLKYPRQGKIVRDA